MSLHHDRLTPSQRGAVAHRMRFLADIAAKAKECNKPKPAPTPEPEPVVVECVAPAPAPIPQMIPRRHPSIEHVMAVAARRFGILVPDLQSSQRQKQLSYARHVAMFVAHEITFKSYPEIARRFGGRDHTTCIHAVRKIFGLIVAGDAATIEHVDAIADAVRVGRYDCPTCGSAA